MIPTVRKPPHRNHKLNALTPSRPSLFQLNSHQLHCLRDHPLCQQLGTPAILVPLPNPSQNNAQRQTPKPTVAMETRVVAQGNRQEVRIGGENGQMEVKHNQVGYLSGIFFEKRGRLMERSQLMKYRIEDSDSEDECEFGLVEGKMASMSTVDEEEEKENINYYENTQETMERERVSVVHFSTHFNSERNERSPKTGNWDLLSEK